MSKSQRAWRTSVKWVLASFVISFVAVLVSCGNRPKQGLPSAGKPLGRALTLVTGDGSLAVRESGGAFTPMKQGEAISGAVELRGTGSGGAASLDDGDQRIAKIWIKGAGAISFGEDEGGHVRVIVTAGEARIRSLDPRTSLALVTSSSLTELSGRDVLVAASSASSGSLALLDVGSHLDAAGWSFALEAESTAVGIGTLDAKATEESASAPSQKPSAATRLLLTRLAVSGRLAGDFVETSVDHTFHNPGDARLEGTFRFPMPEGAILVGLSMEIDGKMMDGELVEEQKAQQVYQRIVDQMQDPALLQWEQGTTFKLRVFPIEPKSDKRVVLRYLSPLHQGAGGFEWIYATAAPGMQTAIPSFHVELDGKSVVDAKEFLPGQDVVVPVSGVAVGQTFREIREDGVYTVVKVRPDWAKVSAPSSNGKNGKNGKNEGRRLVVVVDTSRSMLEERPLALQTLRMILSDLRPIDRFRVLTADVEVRELPGELVAPTAQTIDAAVAFVEAVEPDGASDVGAMLHGASALLKKAKAAEPTLTPEVLYLGDGVATWGETDPLALEKIAQEQLGDSPLHAVVIGKGADGDVLRAIASMHGGLVGTPRTQLEARELSTVLAHVDEVKHLANVTVKAGEGEVVFPAAPTSLFEGEELTVLIFTPKGKTPSNSLALSAVGYAQDVAVGQATGAPHVAQRWAVQEIAALEHEGDAKKDEAVKLSLDYQVMCKHTSFLVLESEEAYAQYDIERRSKKSAAAQAITGADLESIAAQTASLEPNHLQPGDPEVFIPAPADAQSVIVVLPFGETKIARWEDELEMWTVRFLVDKGTPDGTYEIVVRITRADGTLEVQKLAYVVDTKKPTVKLAITPAKGKPGSFRVMAAQVVTMAELVSTIPEADRTGDVEADKKSFASVLTDVKRVEVRMPDGQELLLTALELGKFEKIWTPSAAVDPSKGIEVHVVAIDRAVNENAFDVTLSVQP